MKNIILSSVENVKNCENIQDCPSSDQQCVAVCRLKSCKTSNKETEAIDLGNRPPIWPDS